jgi:hypothetical protein
MVHIKIKKIIQCYNVKMITLRSSNILIRQTKSAKIWSFSLIFKGFLKLCSYMLAK